MMDRTFALSKKASRLFDIDALRNLVGRTSEQRAVWFEDCFVYQPLLMTGITGRFLRRRWVFEVSFSPSALAAISLPNGQKFYPATKDIESLLQMAWVKRPWRECWWKPWTRWRRARVVWEEDA